MAIIELNLERPALKRVEQYSEPTERDDEIREVEPLAETEAETESSGGLISMRRILLLGIVAVVGFMAVRRIRARFGGEEPMETPIDVETPTEATAE